MRNKYIVFLIQMVQKASLAKNNDLLDDFGDELVSIMSNESK